MKKYIWLALLALLGTALLAAPAASKPDASSPITAPVRPADKPPPGVEAAQALSTITGVAISPLLGVGAVGVWRYFDTPDEKRRQLPWFAQPWFWGSALLLVALVFLKDALGPAMPLALKKPLDVLELFENKISALVVTGAFVPLVAAIFHSATTEGSSLSSSWGLAAIDPSSLYNVLVTPLAMLVFLAVWLAAHVINVLILVSPFATLDAMLKSFRLFLLSTVAATAVLNPYVGAAWSLLIILVAFLIAGWSMRMTVFGSVFAWDLLTFRRTRFQPDPVENWAFTARKAEKTPVRSYGKVLRDEQGRLVFRYRPWLVLPARAMVLPEGRYFVGRGLFFPEIRRGAGEDSQALCILPPRFCTHEERLAQCYGFPPVEDIGLRKGLTGFWRWLRALSGFRQKQPVAVPTVAG